jgi:hypothetical protein
MNRKVSERRLTPTLNQPLIEVEPYKHEAQHRRSPHKQQVTNKHVQSFNPTTPASEFSWYDF